MALSVPNSYPQFDSLYGWTSQVTGNTAISVDTGIGMDSTNVMWLQTTSTITMDLTTTGLNALDTGSLAASTVYALYIIGDSKNFLQTGAILSASLSGAIAYPSDPTGQSNYDCYRLIGYAITDSSSHLMVQYIMGTGVSKTVRYATAVQVLNGGTSSAGAAVDCSSCVPAVNRTVILATCLFTPATANDYASFGAPTISAATLLGPVVSGVVASKVQSDQLQLLTTLSSSVAKFGYINSAASGSTTVNVQGYNINL